MFRPREATREAEEAFREVVALLARLRESEQVDYVESHVTRTEAGVYLAVGPVELTPAGKAALERDQRLGPRPWRTVSFHGAPNMQSCTGSLVAVKAGSGEKQRHDQREARLPPQFAARSPN